MNANDSSLILLHLSPSFTIKWIQLKMLLDFKYNTSAVRTKIHSFYYYYMIEVILGQQTTNIIIFFLAICIVAYIY